MDIRLRLASVEVARLLARDDYADRIGLLCRDALEEISMLGKLQVEQRLGYEARIADLQRALANKLQVQLEHADRVGASALRVDVASRCLAGLLASRPEGLNSSTYGGAVRAEMVRTSRELADRLLEELRLTPKEVLL